MTTKRVNLKITLGELISDAQEVFIAIANGAVFKEGMDIYVHDRWYPACSIEYSVLLEMLSYKIVARTNTMVSKVEPVKTSVRFQRGYTWNIENRKL